MLLNSLILAISSSIDSLGVGISYGIKNIKLSFRSKIILFIFPFIITYISVLFGNFIKNILPCNYTKFIGSSLIIFIGIYICYKSKIIKSQNIFNNPISSDLDSSNIIDCKESLFLTIALSLDSFCIGIGASIININIILFPLGVAFFQLFFIILGNILGKKINKFYSLPPNIYSMLSGFLLILIGFIKLFI